MEYNSSVDTASVQALLDSLRASTAWQVLNGGTAEQNSSENAESTVVDTKINALPATYPPQNDTPTPSVQSSSAVSVASLLSQLQSTSNITTSGDVLRPPYIDQYNPQVADPPVSSISQPPAYPQTRPQDLRSCTLQQALPHLARLSEDPKSVAAMHSMKEEQAQLEKRLWDERQAIEKKHEEKVRVARTKANLIGVGLTQYEADTMTDSFRRELQKFDVERALPAWDGLIKKQQTALESLGVPAMFPTTVAEDRKRQQRIIHVLANFAE